MLVPRQTTIPSVVRIKPGALDRLGIYAEREKLTGAAREELRIGALREGPELGLGLAVQRRKRLACAAGTERLSPVRTSRGSRAPPR